MIASNKTEAAVFNEFINKLIDRNTKKFNQDQKSAKIDLPSWLSIKYKVLYFLNKRLISIIFYRDAFISGEAHPIHDTLVVNFDFMSNSNLKLVQLFRSSHFYLKEIAAYCQAVLHKRQSIQQSPVSFILQGAAPKRVNYQKWNITTKGLQVTFAPGQVAPAVAGRQVVLIPCDYISHHLKASFHYICHPTR